MSSPSLSQYRAELLDNVRGNILEIGFGTGLNLAHYSELVEKITTIDSNPGVAKLAEKRIQRSIIPVEYRILNGEQLPMEANTFDYVVSTWTLCSIVNVNQALREIHRVLKPGGQFLFIEHGLSNNPNIQVWQNRLNPFQKIIGDGCNLNRNMQTLIEAQFKEVTLECFEIPSLPRFIGYTYKGIAVKMI